MHVRPLPLVAALLLAGCLEENSRLGSDALPPVAEGEGEGEGAAEGEGEGAAEGEGEGAGEGEGEGPTEGEGEGPAEGEGEGPAEGEGEGPGEGEGEGGDGCIPVPDGREICDNGTDDDCDGETDEGFEIDEPCEAGVGACYRRGDWVCTVDGHGVYCGIEPGAPRSELCGDGIDDDCDGQTDEGFPVGEPCELGLGACRAQGTWACSESRIGVVCDTGAGSPGLERCGNGIDDDCDGETDEAQGLGEPCSRGQGVCARDGVRVCGPDGIPACSAQAAAPDEPEGEVTCDGRDNDCDGQTDEWPAGAAPCEAGTGVCLRRGELICREGQLSCPASAGRPPESPEVSCDGRDNDCDGETDEELTGQRCGAGVGACRVEGWMVCGGPDGVRCNVVPRQPPEPAELTCDGVDNDCDDETDEDCDDDEDGWCDDRMQVTAGAAVCPESAAGQGDDCDDADGGVHPGEADRCSGTDEDCDGQTDEDGDAQGAACVPPYVGGLAATPGRWMYGGEIGVEGGRHACAASYGIADLCTLPQLERAVGAAELLGTTDETGARIRSFWMERAERPEGERCTRADGQSLPWSESAPDAQTTGHGVFLSEDQSRIVASQATNCSVPRHVACCGWAR